MHTIQTARCFALTLLFLTLVVPLSSEPLQSLVERALVQSSQMHDLELFKKNALITKRANETTEEMGVTLRSGTVTASYDDSKNAYSFSTTGIGATFALPNDGKTTIDVSTGTVGLDAPYSYYLVNPSVSMSHTITYGYTTDNRKSLVDRQTEILANTTYESRKLSFISDLYGQISGLLKNESSIKTTEKEIDDLQRNLEQNLTLRLVREGSLNHQGQLQLIKTKEATLAGLHALRSSSLKQFANTFGFIWEGVDSIQEPDLTFSASPNGNSSVLDKQLALRIAQEDLALEKAKYTNRSLELGGGLRFNSSTKAVLGDPTATHNKINAGAEATLTTYQFSLGGSVSGTYNATTNSFNPSVSISGTWNNNPTSTVDMLTLQTLENDKLRAEISYTNALQDYHQQASELENSIADWKLRYALLLQSMEYNLEVLKQQQTLLERGLAHKQEVLDAQFTVDMDAYNLATILLEGLVLENTIRAMQL